MVNFINWLYHSFVEFISILSSSTANFIQTSMLNFGEIDNDLTDLNINLALFSETPILTTNVYDMLLLVFSIFYTVMFVVIIYKIIKKVLVKITGWHRW